MNRLKWHGAKAQRHLESKVKGIPGRIADVIAANARRIVVVKSGELQASIEATGDSVVATADHAAAIEFGTAKRAAQPFMRPAIKMFQKSDLINVVK